MGSSNSGTAGYGSLAYAILSREVTGPLSRLIGTFAVVTTVTGWVLSGRPTWPSHSARLARAGLRWR